jgi:hypothetical protein
MLIRPASPATEAPSMSILPARTAAVALALLLASLPCACKRKSAPEPDASAAPPAPGSAALPPEQASRCRRLTVPGLTIEFDAPAPGRAPESLAEAEADEEDDDAARLPFGVFSDDDLTFL